MRIHLEMEVKITLSKHPTGGEPDPRHS